MDPIEPASLEDPPLPTPSLLVTFTLLYVVAKPHHEFPSWRASRRVFPGHWGSDLPARGAQRTPKAACSHCNPTPLQKEGAQEGRWGEEGRQEEGGPPACLSFLPSLAGSLLPVCASQKFTGIAGMKKSPGHVIHTSEANC